MNQAKFAGCERRNLVDEGISNAVTMQNKTRTRTDRSCESSLGGPGCREELQHILLKSANDRILLEQIHDRRVTFENLGLARFAGGELSHVALSVAHPGKPFGAFGDCFSFYLGLERGSLFFENVVKELLRHVWPINFLSRF